MKCVKCGQEIADNSLFCQFCGKKQVTQKRPKARAKKGNGSVYLNKKLNKYRAQVNTPSGRVSLGHYATEREAWEAINKFFYENKNPHPKECGTVADLYEKWAANHYQNISSSAVYNYQAAWKHLEPIHNIKVEDLKTKHIQRCINEAAVVFSRAVCEKIKNLASMLCQCATKDDVINKNYALLVELPPQDAEEVNPFSDSEVAMLWDNSGSDTVKIILMMIYTGFRPSELLHLKLFDVDLKRGFVRGGSKTAAGKNRIIPIHARVRPFFEYFYDKALKCGNTYLIYNNSGRPYDINNWRPRYFYRELEKIGILKGESDRHVTPYSCRHTFATLCDRAGINDNLIIKMVGHTTKKTTDRFYIHKDEEDLEKAISMLQ